MKVVTWNCSGGLHEKHQKLLALAADIFVIQECSKPDIVQFSPSEGWSSWWVGEEQKKGLGVLVREPWVIRGAQPLTPKWTGKVVIDGPESINLYPVWAHVSESPAAEYIEQVHLLLDLIEHTRTAPFTIVAGDFNSNSKWDSEYGISKNHSTAVDRFCKLGLESAYHVLSGNAQGAERDPTHWNLKKKEPGYHVDYVFLSRQLLPKLKNVTVGHCDDWLALSDHAPVAVEPSL